MDESADGTVSSGVKTESDWGPWRLLGFRLLFCYSLLYLLVVWFAAFRSLAAGSGVAPGLEWVSSVFSRLWAPVVIWCGAHILHWHRHMKYFSDGNSDGPFGYTQLFCVAVLALAGALLWTLVDGMRQRKRMAYHSLMASLRVCVRYAFVALMLNYAMVKFFDVQFHFLGLAETLRPYGKFAPFELLLAFMGASRPYTIFAGIAELMAAGLVAFRRTTLLGALVGLGVMTNVLMLNVCYDWPEKMDATHLILMALFLVAPDGPRLVNFLVLNRTTQPAQPRPVSASAWIRKARPWLKAGVVAYLLLCTVMIGRSLHTLVEGTRAPIYGIYDVEEFTRNGTPAAPLTTDKTRWNRVIFESGETVSVQGMDEAVNELDAKFDANAHRLTILTGDRDVVANPLLYYQPDGQHLELSGHYGPDAIDVKLKRVDETKLPLLAQKFRWVNGQP